MDKRSNLLSRSNPHSARITKIEMNANKRKRWTERTLSPGPQRPNSSSETRQSSSWGETRRDRRPGPWPAWHPPACDRAAPWAPRWMTAPRPRWPAASWAGPRTPWAIPASPPGSRPAPASHACHSPPSNYNLPSSELPLSTTRRNNRALSTDQLRSKAQKTTIPALNWAKIQGNRSNFGSQTLTYESHSNYMNEQNNHPIIVHPSPRKRRWEPQKLLRRPHLLISNGMSTDNHSCTHKTVTAV